MTRTRTPTYTLTYVYISWYIDTTQHDTTQHSGNNAITKPRLHISTYTRTYIHTQVYTHTHASLSLPPPPPPIICMKSFSEQVGPGVPEQAGGRTKSASMLELDRIGSTGAVCEFRFRPSVAPSSTRPPPPLRSPESHNTDFPLPMYPLCPLPSTLQDQK